VPLQPVIRDIWYEHVLYEGDAVSGIIDFGAMRIDSVATDIARLLGSMVEDDQDGWQAGLNAYQSVRRLSADELELVRVFDSSTVLLSGLNWLQWVFAERRQFSNRRKVELRLEGFAARLSRLIASGRTV
jgi:homoserine kinase type II